MKKKNNAITAIGMAALMTAAGVLTAMAAQSPTIVAGSGMSQNEAAGPGTVGENAAAEEQAPIWGTIISADGSSIDLGCNDMELSESLTDHLFDDPKQSIDGLIAEHYTILWAYATLREKLKWYEDAGIPVIPNYGLSTIRRAINRYGTAPQLQMAIKEMSELTKAICNLQRAVTFNYRNGAKIKVAHESVREEIADVYIMLAHLVEIVGKPEEVQQIVLEKLEQLKGCLDDGEVRSE